MPGYYRRGVEPELEDFLAQIVPTPPPTDHSGGVLFMLPLEPRLVLWRAYVRHGPAMDAFDGPEGEFTVKTHVLPVDARARAS